MSTYKKPFYYSFAPKFIREPLKRRHEKNTILDYYESLPDKDINTEEKEALSYLAKNKISVFPYDFQNNYKKRNIEVFNDASNGLKYILFEDKKLYFKRKSSARGIRRNYTALLIEQDENAAHRYLTPTFDINENDILVDVGAAEGNLPLEVIEKVKKVYLFETNPEWIEALEATFAPWKDKVEIVNKFVSDINDERHVSLDEFFKNKEPYTFLKIDAEGAEGSVLEGGKDLVKNQTDQKVALCTYHKPNDFEYFSKYLIDRGFKIEHSKGYMIFTEPRTFSPPYLRRGIIRATKA